MINWFKKFKNIDFKHLFIVVLITLLIGFCVLAICLLNKYDENRSKTILNKYDDDVSLYINANLSDESENVLLNISRYEFKNLSFQTLLSGNVGSSVYNSNNGLTYLDLGWLGRDLTNVYCCDLYYNSSVVIDISSIMYSYGSSSPDLHFVFYSGSTIVSNLNYINNVFPEPYVFTDTFSFNMLRVILPSSSNGIGSYTPNVYIGSSASMYNYNSGFNDGFNSRDDEINNLNNIIDNLQNQNSSLSQRYNTLNEQYQALLNDHYTFSELFWSISAVPFGVLTSAFNVDVLGVNLRGIITGLFTAMLLIWLIKHFFK